MITDSKIWDGEDTAS